MKRIAVFASGRGSNFLAIQNEIEAGHIPARVVCVISDHARPPVFAKAHSHDIATHWVNRKQFNGRQEYADALLKLLDSYRTDLVILAGYMKLIPVPVVQRYRHRMINIHPALLPNFGGKGFYGMRVHEAVIDSGVKVSGVTVHFVDEHYDTGSIIKQEKVDVQPGDTPESLAARVLQVEHCLYPAVVKAICEDRITVKGGKVVWESE